MGLAVRLAFIPVLLGGFALPVPAADVAMTRIGGNWLTEPRDGIIHLSVDAQGNLQGRIVGGNHPGLRDEHNPDAALRSRELRGQIILKDMKYDGNGRWSGGTIYKPDNGKTYKCKVELRDDDTLGVRGFIGFSLLGVTQTWTRYTGTSMDLPPGRQGAP
jgi:uncharacterized protein (DUF2147 family)